jgi:hypothetical protein
MTAITKSDCQGEDPIMILVERLRQSARLSTAKEMNPQGFPIEKNLYWRSADALLLLRQERDRLREGLEIIAGKRPCLDNLMSNQDVARAALHKDQAS